MKWQSAAGNARYGLEGLVGLLIMACLKGIECSDDNDLHKETYKLMQTYKFFLKTHKWTGILFSVVFLNIAISGILLLEKKNFAWIQPPTIAGAEGSVEDFIATQKLFEIVFGQGNADFRNIEDVDRVDFRPGKRVFKVRSKHNYAEIQVDAVTGGILSVDSRPSDLLEALHDGSYYAESVHAILMPVTGGGLILLSASGLYLWLATWLRKRRQKRK